MKGEGGKGYQGKGKGDNIFSKSKGMRGGKGSGGSGSGGSKGKGMQNKGMRGKSKMKNKDRNLRTPTTFESK
jgi:hypothetical protein